MATVPTRRDHRANRRTLRAALRQRTAATRSATRAHRAVATGTPQTARTHLVAAGLEPQTAKRYAGAFSKGVSPTLTGETVVKLKGRVTKRCPVKLYDVEAFTARLSVYRPKNPAAAAQFAALAA